MILRIDSIFHKHFYIHIIIHITAGTTGYTYQPVWRGITLVVTLLHDFIVLAWRIATPGH
jgi:hypothetical protein